MLVGLVVVKLLVAGLVVLPVVVVLEVVVVYAGLLTVKCSV